MFFGGQKGSFPEILLVQGYDKLRASEQETKRDNIHLERGEGWVIVSLFFLISQHQVEVKGRSQSRKKRGSLKGKPLPFSPACPES